MSQSIDIARVSADNAKRIAGGILCSGMGNTQTELLAQAVADLANAIEGLAEHCEPKAPVNQLGQSMPKVVHTLDEIDSWPIPPKKPSEAEYARAKDLLDEMAAYMSAEHATQKDVEDAIKIVKAFESPFIGPATGEDLAGLNLV